MQTEKEDYDQRRYEEIRNKDLAVRRSGIDNLKQKELQRLAVWLGVPVWKASMATMKDGCRAAWDKDETFLGDRIQVPPPPTSGTKAQSYKSSEAYKTYQSRTVQSGIA